SRWRSASACAALAIAAWLASVNPVVVLAASASATRRPIPRWVALASSSPPRRAAEIVELPKSPRIMCLLAVEGLVLASRTSGKRHTPPGGASKRLEVSDAKWLYFSWLKRSKSGGFGPGAMIRSRAEEEETTG